MATIKRILVLCCMGYFSVDGHCQDFQIIGNDVTTVSHALSHAAVLHDSTIIAVGGYGWGTGTIIISTDYGQSWTKTEVLHNLFHVTFVNDSVGFAVGEGATIMKTVDGGESWVYQNTSAISPAFELRTVAFANADTGFVGTANGPGFAYLYTYDGGETWENVSETGSVYGRAKIQVVDDSTVYSLGYGDGAPLYRSNNLGQSWEPIMFPEGLGSPRSMHFFDRDTGIVALRKFDVNCGSNFYVVNTDDGGNTWSSQHFNCTYFNNLIFPDREIGYATGSLISSIDYRSLWRTIDGGDTWNEFEYPVGENANEGCIAMSIACVDADTCYLPTNYGIIIKMTNATGSVVNTPQVAESIDFSIHPNPTSSHLTLTGTTLQPGTHITAYSLTGQQVYARQLNQAHAQLTIDARQFGPAGMYLLHIQTPGQVAVVKKVVVQE